MLDSPMLVDQNMVCGSNTDQRDHFFRIHLGVSLFSGICQICIPTFLFGPPMQSELLHTCSSYPPNVYDYYYIIS